MGMACFLSPIPAAMARLHIPVSRSLGGRTACLLARAALVLASSCLLSPKMAVAQSMQPFSAAGAGDKLPLPWRIVPFPGGAKPVTQFTIETMDGVKVLKVLSNKSYGTVLHDLAPVVLGPGSRLRWRWRLEQPLLQADLKRRDGDDSAVKVCALFDMGVDKLGPLERAVLSLARSRAAEPLPAATLCYVWDHLLPEGASLANVFSARVRLVVMDSGEAHLGQWRLHERDLAADFMRAFGHETDQMPPLIGIAVGADSDNTLSIGMAYVGDITLQAVPVVKP
jgi:Protein of unknown function (DUF3047)